MVSHMQNKHTQKQNAPVKPFYAVLRAKAHARIELASPVRVLVPVCYHCTNELKYALLRLGFEPRTQVSKTHVLTVYTNRADSIRVSYP